MGFKIEPKPELLKSAFTLRHGKKKAVLEGLPLKVITQSHRATGASDASGHYGRLGPKGPEGPEGP